jgi:beta-lactamase superfamily II metal-dependent hydrolase
LLSAGRRQKTGDFKVILDIFDVEHGACALITTSGGKHIMVDCGDNTSTGWAPGSALLARGIFALERLIVTNYDEDHASGFANLYRNIAVFGLQRNGNVSAQLLHHLKSEHGIGRGIAGLASTFSYFNGPPLPTAVDDITIDAFCNQPGIPPFGFDDENNLSLCIFISCGVHRIIFPGDMEKSGWRALLANPWFVHLLKGVTLFLASHHGRENGYCEEVLNLCPNIQAVIISDKKKGHQSQETVDRYRQYAHGFVYNGDDRHVLTTRRDSNMHFEIPSVGGGAVVLLGLAA